MALPHSMTTISSAQVGPGLTEVKAILNSVDATALLERLRLYRWTGSRWRGRSGYSVEALWRAVLLSYILNIPSTSALIRRLQEEPRLRRICGFKALPQRSTFSRFFSRVSLHLDLVQLATTTATDRLRDYLPNLGDKVAVDSTVVSSYSNPNRHPISDPEASWTAKTSTRPGAKNGTEWSFGYKLHVAADAEHGIPLFWGIVNDGQPQRCFGVAHAHRRSSRRLPLVSAWVCDWRQRLRLSGKSPLCNCERGSTSHSHTPGAEQRATGRHLHQRGCPYLCWQPATLALPRRVSV